MRPLIIGAGPAGLSIAKALQNRGFFPEIIERGTQIHSDGSGIAIPANGSYALEQLGFDLASKALRIQHMLFTDDRGERLVEEEIATLHPKGSQFYSLSRRELIQLLASSLDPKISIRTATTLKHFSEDADGVTVEYSTGEVKHFDWMIACDGIHSSIRRQFHPEETAQFLNLHVWRTLIAAPKALCMPTYMLGPDRILLLYPLPDRQAYLYGQLFQEEKRGEKTPFAHLFSSFGSPGSEALEQITPMTSFHLHHMERSHSVRYQPEGSSRILLAGDAAHAFGPSLQNGAAQAFEDAYVLQDLLAHPYDVPALIEAFAKRRLPRVEKIFSLSNYNMKVLSDPNELAGRNEAIRKTGAPNVQGFRLISATPP